MCEHVDAAWDQVVLAVDSKRSDLDGERVDLMNAEHVGRKTTCCQWLMVEVETKACETCP